MKKIFFAGLATLLPLAVTFWAITFLVGLLTRPFMGIVKSFLISFPAISTHIPTQAISFISKGLILVALFFFLVLLGCTARFFFLKSLIRLGDAILHKIPLVNKVYKTSKEIVQSLFGSKNGSFKQAVLFPFPHPGSYALGLISSPSPTTCCESTKSELISVFVPTTPNPTTGYLVLCKKEDLVLLDMDSESCLKYVVSCAVIQPGEKIK